MSGLIQDKRAGMNEKVTEISIHSNTDTGHLRLKRPAQSQSLASRNWKMNDNMKVKLNLCKAAYEQMKLLWLCSHFPSLNFLDLFCAFVSHRTNDSHQRISFVHLSTPVRIVVLRLRWRSRASSFCKKWTEITPSKGRLRPPPEWLHSLQPTSPTSLSDSPSQHQRRGGFFPFLRADDDG